MASPEVLGITTGAAVGFVLLLALQPDAERWATLLCGGGGAVATLALVLAIARDGGAERALIVGIALSAVLSALLSLLVTAGALQSAVFLNWLAGSTYNATAGLVMVLLVVALGLLGLAPGLRRWLDILPLQLPVAQALGVPIDRARGAILLTAGLAAACATLATGPLGFVGLIAPHLVRLAGVRRVVPFLATSTLAGAAITVAADWVGRNIIFPYELPAGLITTLIGAPIFVWLLLKPSAMWGSE